MSSLKRKRNEGPARLDYRLINAAPPERLRQYRDNGYVDVTAETAARMVKAYETTADLTRRVQSIEPSLDLTQEQLPAVQRAWDEMHSIAGEVTSEYKRAWHHHTQLRDALEPTSPAVLFELWRQSWVHVCRCAIITQQVQDMTTGCSGFEPWPEVLHRTAKSFNYVDTMSSMHRQLALNDEVIGKYSPRVLMTSMGLLCEALDSHGWTPSAGEYMHALFLRYALILHDPAAYVAEGGERDLGQWEASTPTEEKEKSDSEDEDDADGTEVAEEPLAGAAILSDPMRRFREPLLAPARLRTAFLDVAERLFFHHLWRDHALRALWHLPCRTLANEERDPGVALLKARAQWRLDYGVPALARLLRDMLTSNANRDSFIASLQNFYPSRLVWPGEREQMLFEYTEEADGGDAYAVLFRLRIDHYKHMQKTLHFDDAMRYVNEYCAHEKALANVILALPDKKLPASTLEWLESYTGQIRRLGLDHERLLLLMFEFLFDRTLETQTAGASRLQFVHNAYPDDRSLPKAAARPPFDLRSWHHNCMGATWPRFAAVWLNYTVAPPGPMALADRERSSLVTSHLVDALAAWLTLAKEAPCVKSLLAPTGFCRGQWARLTMPPELLPRPVTWA
jgi:hypothetical protein